MLTIGCYNESSIWFPELFVIKDVDSMEQLKRISQEELPVLCHKPQSIYNRSILLLDDMNECYVFLDNYQYYRDLSDRYYLFTSAEFDQIKERQCNSCSKRTSCHGLDCRYREDGVDLHCVTYEKEWTSKIGDWIRNRKKNNI